MAARSVAVPVDSMSSSSCDVLIPPNVRVMLLHMKKTPHLQLANKLGAISGLRAKIAESANLRASKCVRESVPNNPARTMRMNEFSHVIVGQYFCRSIRVKVSADWRSATENDRELCAFVRTIVLRASPR